MVKVEVIERFTLQDFDKLESIERKSVDTKGTLYVGDIFKCSDEMAKYLLGDNPLQRAVVKVIEVEPKEAQKKEEPKVVIKEVAIELPKKKKKKTSKK